MTLAHDPVLAFMDNLFQVLSLDPPPTNCTAFKETMLVVGPLLR
jgi:hypothetical protein